MGLSIMLVSVAWLGLISVLGTGKGSSLATNYGYLAHGHVGSGLTGIVAIVGGMLRRPGTALRVLKERRHEIYRFLAGVGTIGIFSTIGVGMVLVVLAANALNMSPVFIGKFASFQSLAPVLFTAVGAVAVVTWLVRRGRTGRLLVVLIGTAALVQSFIVSVHSVPQAGYFLKVNAPTARALDDVRRRIPARAEVIASQGVIGRFGGHQWVYPFLDSFSDGQTVPIRASVVAFVFTPDAGIEAATPAQTRAAIALVKEGLHPEAVAEGSGVYAYLWHAPGAVSSITFSSHDGLTQR